MFYVTTFMGVCLSWKESTFCNDYDETKKKTINKIPKPFIKSLSKTKTNTLITAWCPWPSSSADFPFCK